jgi:hypothetical protein
MSRAPSQTPSAAQSEQKTEPESAGHRSATPKRHHPWRRRWPTHQRRFGPPQPTQRHDNASDGGPRQMHMIGRGCCLWSDSRGRPLWGPTAVAGARRRTGTGLRCMTFTGCELLDADCGRIRPGAAPRMPRWDACSGHRTRACTTTTPLSPTPAQRRPSLQPAPPAPSGRSHHTLTRGSKAIAACSYHTPGTDILLARLVLPSEPPTNSLPSRDDEYEPIRGHTRPALGCLAPPSPNTGGMR